MNTLFLIPYPENENKNNLYRKFTSQINSAKKIGGRVFYTSYDDKRIYINEVANPEYKALIGKKLGVNQNFVRMFFIMRAVRKWLKKEALDMVYMRVITPSPTFRKTFKILKKENIPLVVEIPTYPGTSEAKNSDRKFFYFLVKCAKFISGNAYKGMVRLYTLIGEKANEYADAPAINIENGLNVSDVSIKNGFETHCGELHLLVAAYFAYWHGYDRLIKGMIEYYKNEVSDRKVIVHLCGKPADGSLDEIFKIIKENKLEDYIIYHGYLSGKDLDDMYDKCDVAIGSLGLHRQNIIIDTTLKLPEYSARAIPFVFCTDSNNVDKEGNYYLKLAADESPIDIAEIITFFDSLDKTTIQNEIRGHAETSLGWDSQFKKVIDYLESR